MIIYLKKDVLTKKKKRLLQSYNMINLKKLNYYII